MYSINFTENNTKFCLSLDCNGTNSYLCINGKKIIKFKAKDSEIKAHLLCLGKRLASRQYEKGWIKWICL